MEVTKYSIQPELDHDFLSGYRELTPDELSKIKEIIKYDTFRWVDDQRRQGSYRDQIISKLNRQEVIVELDRNDSGDIEILTVRDMKEKDLLGNDRIIIYIDYTR